MFLLTADQILGRTWRQLYSGGDHANIQREWRDYAMIWHPDKSKDPRAPDVFNHVTKARDRALGLTGHDEVSFPTARGHFKFRYLKKRIWDAGAIYVTESAVVYHIPADLKDLAETAAARRWEFPDDGMKNEMTRFLPNLTKTVLLADNSRLLIYRRNPDQILLADLIDHSAVPDVHVMWMVSALLNIGSYFCIEGLTHYGLVPEVMLVSLEMHSVAITGPALYMANLGDRPKAVPPAILAQWPALKDKTAQPVPYQPDTRQIRAIAMRALGIKDRVTLRNRTDLNEGLVQFINSPTAKNTVEDYAKWTTLRGKRKFIVYDLKPEQVYDLG